jgi:SAM-dependent methyltransferase
MELSSDAAEKLHRENKSAAQAVMKRRSCCPGCLSPSLSPIYEEPFSAAAIQGYLLRHYEGQASDAANESSYILARCNSCGLVFQQLVPDESLLDEIYNSWVPGTELERRHRNYSLDEYRYLAEQVQFVIEHFDCLPSELHVLDFGFGWGHWSRMAMGFGCRVSGVEFSEERSDHARGLGIEVLELSDLPDGRFRFINTEQVFEHLVEPRAVLQRLIRSLTRDGLIKISVPNAAASLKKLARGSSFAALSPSQQMAVQPLEHINAFDYASLVSLGASVGLKPIRPSFYQLYNSASGLMRLREAARVMIRPIYRHIYPRSTFVYFARA